MSTKHILLTGGNGFIGSHTAVSLLESGYKVTLVDNLINSNKKCFERIKEISKKPDMIDLVIADIRNYEEMTKLFKEHGPFDSVIHFAAYKCVPESVAHPMKYYNNNIGGTLNLLKVMQENKCMSIIFSSSCTVYGNSKPPLSEESITGVGVNCPYGWTKFMMEQILKDLHTANPLMSVVLLRYFNPVGAHPSGLIGESPNGIPTNLMPFVLQVASGQRELVNVFGHDYDTPDHTCIRDYIHVMDIAEGHVAALNWLFDGDKHVCEAFNLGTGIGLSVLDVIHGIEKACGHSIKYVLTDRRPGDLPSCYCIPNKARDVLHWTSKRNLDDMCKDAWNWQTKNPHGFDE